MVVGKSQGTQVQSAACVVVVVVQVGGRPAGQQRLLVRPDFGDHVPIGGGEHDHTPSPRPSAEIEGSSPPGHGSGGGGGEGDREAVSCGREEVVEVYLFPRDAPGCHAHRRRRVLLVVVVVVPDAVELVLLLLLLLLLSDPLALGPESLGQLVTSPRPSTRLLVRLLLLLQDGETEKEQVLGVRRENEYN